MFDFKNNIEEWWHSRMRQESERNVIRIAIVGSVSSGKSFLMEDMVQVLLGFNIGEGGCLAAFNRRDHSPAGEGSQTPVYLARKTDFYETNLIGNKKLQMLDMPGEAFDENTSSLYGRLIESLLSRGKIFEELKYLNQDTNDEVFILKYYKSNDSESKIDADDEYYKNHYYNAAQRIGFYEGNGYKLVNNWKKKRSGRYVANHLLDYDVDSLMSAIMDAKNELDLNNIDKVLEQSMMKLYFWFYARLSTDVVFCYRLAVNNNGEKDQSGNKHLVVSLVDLFERMNEDNLKNNCRNYYLAYKGVDALFKETELKKASDDLHTITEVRNIDEMARKTNVIHDLLYSKVAAYLFRYFLPRIPADKKDIVNIDNCWFNIDGILSSKIDDARTMLRNQIAGGQRSFCSVITREGIFERNPIPSFVFFTSTVINTNYEIWSNESKDNSIFFKKDNNGGDVNRPEYRLCFGTRQLLLSLLYRNDIPIDGCTVNPIVLKCQDFSRNLWKMMTGQLWSEDYDY
ncbi:MAG: hypothetical protein IKJ59_06840 [Clostridia bacterium]|nr:hypothetical protein [Bacteroidales bacterium]MBR3918435.1 hypothetical protein [Clostridia bacterium]